MIAVHKTNMALTDNYKIHFILFLKRNVPVTVSEEQMCDIASIKPACFQEGCVICGVVILVIYICRLPL